MQMVIFVQAIGRYELEEMTRRGREAEKETISLQVSRSIFDWATSRILVTAPYCYLLPVPCVLVCHGQMTAAEGRKLFENDTPL